MKYLFLILIVACASKKPEFNSDQKCLKILDKKKVISPKGVTSYGVFSNVEKVEELYSGYKIRIVKKGNFCQGLILEYKESLEPQLYAVSNLFECKKKVDTISLVTKLGFYSPYSNEPPEDFYFGLDARRTGTGDLQGFISFPKNDLKNRPAKTKVLMKAMPQDEVSMASFDWELIERIRLKKACFY